MSKSQTRKRGLSISFEGKKSGDTDFELIEFLNQLSDEAVNKSVDDAFERALRKIREYPHCDRLLYNAAAVLEGALALSAADSPRKEEYEQKILSWYEQAADSTDEKIRCSASFLLAAKYINAMEYDKAEEFIKQLPDIVPSCDKPELQAKLLLQQGEPDGAAVILQNNLVQNLVRIQGYSLYHRMKKSTASAGLQSFIPAIIKEAKTSEAYDFLRGNAEFQKLMEQYR